MDDRSWVLEQIELAQRDVPVCVACGEPTVPVPHDGGSIWLECASLLQPRRGLQRLLPLDVVSGHTRRRIVGPAAMQPAAA
jgi:hypothetical protein